MEQGDRRENRCRALTGRFWGRLDVLFDIQVASFACRVQSPDRLTEARWQIVAVMVNRGAMPEISGVIC